MCQLARYCPIFAECLCQLTLLLEIFNIFHSPTSFPKLGVMRLPKVCQFSGKMRLLVVLTMSSANEKKPLFIYFRVVHISVKCLLVSLV